MLRVDGVDDRRS